MLYLIVLILQFVGNVGLTGVTGNAGDSVFIRAVRDDKKSGGVGLQTEVSRTCLLHTHMMDVANVTLQNTKRFTLSRQITSCSLGSSCSVMFVSPAHALCALLRQSQLADG